MNQKKLDGHFSKSVNDKCEQQQSYCEKYTVQLKR